MKFFKSIKWRLQLWYGLILVAVLLGFGLTAYQLEFNRQFRRIYDKLHRGIGVLANALHRPPLRGQNAERPPQGLPPDGQDFNTPSMGDNPSERMPERPRNNFSNGRPPLEFHLPERDAHFFDASDSNGFYFIIHSRYGNELARSTTAPDVVRSE